MSICRGFVVEIYWGAERGPGGGLKSFRVGART
ncbi:MAG: hypothetical protein QG599_1110, partial [Pseudomonadota bacterium]|nr:hypothetical protein [Pseudomonadota bacterium]